jgi:hypothetical protein
MINKKTMWISLFKNKKCAILPTAVFMKKYIRHTDHFFMVAEVKVGG